MNKVFLLRYDTENGDIEEMKIPIPAHEVQIIKREYLLARIYNILVITGPSAFVLYGSAAIRPVLEDVKAVLRGEKKIGARNYTKMMGVVARMHDLGEVVIEIKDLEEFMPNEIYEEAGSIRRERKQRRLSFSKQLHANDVALGIDIGGTDAKFAVRDARGHAP